MNRTWFLSDLEFFVLWQDWVGDHLPAPLLFTSRAVRWVEFMREVSIARERLHHELDGSFTQVLETIARPELRIVVHGVDGENPQNPQRSIRMLVARCGDRGYRVVQAPGETIWHSGGFEVTELGGEGIARAVVESLPRVPAGALGEITLPDEHDQADVDYSLQRSMVTASAFGDSADHRTSTFLRARADTVGVVKVTQGRSKFGPRGLSTQIVSWRDLHGDGRYVISARRPSIAVAADSNRFRAIVNLAVRTVSDAVEDEQDWPRSQSAPW
ncbi:ESX secretion-associated protein EspG [Nocardia sp. CDC160]|uniref:ESX secretion-associated protein EspG n=1 Tax=Nocardia sp. CDC160 TaxID=3112166 RepID=UPI002DBF8CB5|nr:ESX secretion-associated protein EspG [Nocardia sp. CDC160]MEC3920341.1 ESX secretion-associated protein EspG [Nocardia sp. CDC160]